ncbi:MAG TPA: hypothetical protein VN772_07160 [Solirubrobacteraceae bacterium]|nr:hypothetical protein [Solirubrobacteraceae bacterium]
MLQIEARITGCIAWRKGTDNAGMTQYAPAHGTSVLSFAKTVLGNVYAHVETVTGFGVRSAHLQGWDVFETLEGAEQHAAQLGRIARNGPTNSASR